MGSFKNYARAVFDPANLSNLFPSESEDLLKDLSKAGYESSLIQGFLPPWLRTGNIGGFMQSGIGGIGELIQRPGGLSPTVADAIRPRLAAESENIAQNFRGIGAQQAGTLARTNAPVSLKGALESALNVAQERAQRGARREALTESEGLRRADLGQVFKLLEILNQFISSRVGPSIHGSGQLAQS